MSYLRGQAGEVESGTLLMTQRDRDRLIALKKAKKGLITQRQAAEEIGQTERHIRRLLVKLKNEGDQAVVHGRRGRRLAANDACYTSVSQAASLTRLPSAATGSPCRTATHTSITPKSSCRPSGRCPTAHGTP